MTDYEDKGASEHSFLFKWECSENLNQPSCIPCCKRVPKDEYATRVAHEEELERNTPVDEIPEACQRRERKIT